LSATNWYRLLITVGGDFIQIQVMDPYRLANKVS